MRSRRNSIAFFLVWGSIVDLGTIDGCFSRWFQSNIFGHRCRHVHTAILWRFSVAVILGGEGPSGLRSGLSFHLPWGFASIWAISRTFGWSSNSSTGQESDDKLIWEPCTCRDSLGVWRRPSYHGKYMKTRLHSFPSPLLWFGLVLGHHRVWCKDCLILREKGFRFLLLKLLIFGRLYFWFALRAVSRRPSTKTPGFLKMTSSSWTSTLTNLVGFLSLSHGIPVRILLSVLESNEKYVSVLRGHSIHVNPLLYPNYHELHPHEMNACRHILFVRSLFSNYLHYHCAVAFSKP